LAWAALESSGLVDRGAAGIELVVAFGVDQLSGERISAAVRRAGGCRRRRKVVAVEVEAGHGLANGTGSVFGARHVVGGDWEERVVF
jgi:hypothetical protein